ncbi:MAG: hypothetical protein HYX67_16575 [Candidatus Melainabacteria bacterium]|nr:hypothetical protein [Candidatus Melainabacteria bacterium]
MNMSNENVQPASLQHGVTAAVLTYPWMFGRTFDILFFFVPVLIGIMCFSLSQWSAVSGSAFWLFLVLDAFGAGPFHFGPTWFAYFDKKNREHWGSERKKKIIFFLAPFLLIVGTTLTFVYEPYGIVVLLITIWAIQHLVQQNIGILLLYHNQGKGEAIVNRPLEMRSQQFPAILFSLLFFHRIFLNSPQGIGWVVFFALVGIWAAIPVVGYLMEMRNQVREGATVNVPALTFWAISVMTMIPFAFIGKTFNEAWIIHVTVHWFQYIGLNYALVKKKYASDSPLRQDLPKISPMVLFFATCIGLLVAAILIMPVGTAVYKSNPFIAKMLTGLWLGVTACHYFLDAFLWRFREAHARQSILPHLMSYRKAPAPVKP